MEMEMEERKFGENWIFQKHWFELRVSKMEDREGWEKYAGPDFSNQNFKRKEKLKPPNYPLMKWFGGETVKLYRDLISSPFVGLLGSLNLKSVRKWKTKKNEEAEKKNFRNQGRWKISLSKEELAFQEAWILLYGS